MSPGSCGCAAASCDGCAGVQSLTPLPVDNRPGLSALSYRAGTHASFLQTMKARLSTIEVDRTASDGTPLPPLRPLKNLTTRASSDPSIALLDAWASAADVLTFYNERIANECYLASAAERRSVIELSRLIGYTPRPGVAATAYLAYTLDDNQADPVTIAPGARSQSIPGPDETAQSFETSDPLIARREWNNLQVRLKRPQAIRLATALSTEALHVAGVATNLKPGDKLLLLFTEDGSTSVLRSVQAIDAKFDDQRTLITLQPVRAELRVCTPLLAAGLAQLDALQDDEHRDAQLRALARGAELLRTAYLGMPSLPAGWIDELRSAADSDMGDRFEAELAQIEQQLSDALASMGIVPTPVLSDPQAFAQRLLVPPVPQARNALRLRRSLSRVFGVSARAPSLAIKRPLGYSDVGTQLLVGLAPKLKTSFYQAWSGAQLNPAQAPLLGVQVLRTRASLFGATAPKIARFEDPSEDNPGPSVRAVAAWDEWKFEPDELENNAFLDQALDAVALGSYVLVDVAGERQVLRVADAATTPRAAYGIASPSTRLVFDNEWRQTSPRSPISGIRRTQLHLNSEPLQLVEIPVDNQVGGNELELAGLHRELTSGRWVILSGERADIEGVRGVRASELHMVSGLRHNFDPMLAGDPIHTTLLLATETAYRYHRATVTVFGNVVKATHGETRNEPLGSGNGAVSMQSFTLKQPPLTFVPVPSAAGAESTLHVRVNDIEWRETPSLAWLGPKDKSFVTLTDDAGRTTVTFGNGVHGARLPTGVQNVVATYRNGIGSPGNVRAEQISLLQTRPLGVKSVINPLRASGGADKEDRDLARETAPLSVMSFDRLVSVADYAGFARCFAGIAKASALATSDGQRRLVQVTVAAVGDAPIDRDSDLYQNLVAQLRELGDVDLPLRVDVRERIALVLEANIALQTGYAWESVSAAARQRVLALFGFAARKLGQHVSACEVIGAIQSVPGVAYVDVDAFGGVPEMVDDIETDEDGTVRHTRRLLTQDDIADAIQDILTARTAGTLPADVIAWPGGSDRGVLRPAQLAAFVPEVSDTLILNPL